MGRARCLCVRACVLALTRVRLCVCPSEERVREGVRAVFVPECITAVKKERMGYKHRRNEGMDVK